MDYAVVLYFDDVTEERFKKILPLLAARVTGLPLPNAILILTK
jgi:hypothetical protein